MAITIDDLCRLQNIQKVESPPVLRRVASDTKLSPPPLVPRFFCDIAISSPETPKPQVLQANLWFIQHRAALTKAFPHHTQQQQVTLVPSAPPIMATSASAVVPQPSFHGDYEKEEEPTDWIRKYQLLLPPSYSDADKIAWFELQCTAVSPAEEWFMSLQATDKATWVTFLAAFKIQWPPPVHVKLTVAQKKERLKSVILKEEDIGVMIEKDRGRDWGHVKWAK
ncbi:uncharacterized protein EDB91DRAFT_1252946 [Suillus paluster]|uniref:uncharacterized protein n=1 Tax=Suillus paluster TaxID=48578 RepID=UPI001B8714A4|nr:uncharacterized protein EDB91DRAFT_1252946 [Suillus paluster]KAG1729627.1 hypothetical protein EDB91DRAFT_1252946 [Suillus paluster]